MARRLGLFFVAFILSGCSFVEQYHYPGTFSEVPSSVKVALGDKHPTDEIKMDQVVVQKMYDGTMRYRFNAVTRKGEKIEVAIGSDGQEYR